MALQLAILVPGKAESSSAATTAYSAGIDYYFPWYDTASGRTWVLTAMPGSGPGNLFDIYLGTQSLTSGGFDVSAGVTRPNYFSGLMGGPVKVQAADGPGLVSERSLFGNSFEEIWATPYEELDSHYFWPIYDGVAEDGMRNWVLVANPPENDGPVRIEVRIHFPPQFGGPEFYYTTLDPGEMTVPQFPGLRSGPVEVKAWRVNGSPFNPADARKVIASQRVLFRDSFNEMPGIPKRKLWPYWAWTWLDNKSPGAAAWLAVGNPNIQSISLLIISGQSQPVLIDEVPPGETTVVSPVQPIMEGPVLMMACFDSSGINFESKIDSCLESPADIYASQRSIWGPSFSEIAGVTDDDFGTSVHWTWYDQQSPGASNWVLMTNLNEEDIFAEVRIGGGSPRWSGWIGPFQSATPTFPGVMGGPVEVRAWTSSSRAPGTEAEVFASQRVLWNGYFNEIVGKGM
ncbi:MAG: hypothetical protein IBX61_03475 [Thermoleophilia bacterium]|nr:hypothetical protein [Thermoleophilia bacterium]